MIEVIITFTSGEVSTYTYYGAIQPDIEVKGEFVYIRPFIKSDPELMIKSHDVSVIKITGNRA